MKIKHIIWDYNGTLLNDVELCVEVINEMLTTRGKKAITINDYRKVFDFPVKEYYKKVGFDFTDESFEEIGQNFIDKYNQRINQTYLQKDALEVLSNLGQKGFTQHILSARNENELIIETKFFSINRYFDKIVGLDNNYATSKIENGIKLINSIDADKSEIILIGDTNHDCEVAREAGIKAIAISHGHHSRKRLEKCGFEVFDSLKEIEAYLTK